MFKINKKYGDERDTIVNKNNMIFDQIKKIKSKDITDDGKHLMHLSNCAISVEPYQTEEPIYLFGSKQKSIMINKVSVYEALISKDQCKNISKGKPLLEFLISDEMLSTSLIDHNSKTYPISFINIDGNELNVKDIQKDKTSIESVQLELEEHFLCIKEDIESLIISLKEELKKNKVSKKKTNDILSSIQNCIFRLMNDSSYSMHELTDALGKDVNSVLFEINSTIDKLMHYKEPDVLLLGDSQSINKDSFLYAYTKGFFNEKEKSIFRDILKDLETHVSGELALKLKEMISSNDPNIKPLKRKADIINHGTISFMKVANTRELANSKNVSGFALEMRIGVAAQRSKNCFSNELTMLKEIMRISFSLNDLMLLVRAKKDSFVLGTISRYAGQSIPLVKIQESILEKENIFSEKVINTIDDPTIELKKSVTSLNSVLDTDKILKANKNDALSIIHKIEDNLDSIFDDLIGYTFNEQEKINKVFKTDLKDKIENNLKGLPLNVIDKSLIVLK